METLICTVCTYTGFFLVCKLHDYGLKIMTHISDHLRFMAIIDIGDF